MPDALSYPGLDRLAEPVNQVPLWVDRRSLAASHQDSPARACSLLIAENEALLCTLAEARLAGLDLASLDPTAQTVVAVAVETADSAADLSRQSALASWMFDLRRRMVQLEHKPVLEVGAEVGLPFPARASGHSSSANWRHSCHEWRECLEDLNSMRARRPVRRQ